MGLHFGIWATMEVGLFPLVAGLCMVCFLPDWFWDTVVPRFGAALPGLGNLARRLQRLRGAVVRSIRAHLSPLGARLSAAMGIGRAPVSGLTAYDNDHPSGRGASPDAGGGALEAPPTDDGATDDAGQRGASLARRSQSVTLRSWLVTNLLALFFLFYVFCWNITTLTPLSMPTTPGYALGPFLGLYQNWIMFAPDPPKDDGWWIVPGDLQGGRQVDLMSVVRGDYGLREVSYEKPDSITATYKNEHWHKYLEFLATLEDVKDTPQLRAARVVDQREQRENFADYLCRAWNERHAGDERLEDLRIIYMRETSLPDYQRPEVERVVLREHSCR